VPSGQVADIPFTAKVDQQLGPMVHLPIRVDTGKCAGAPDPQRVAFADGRRLAFSALDRLYVMDLPTARRGADERGREGSRWPRGRPMGSRSRT